MKRMYRVFTAAAAAAFILAACGGGGGGGGSTPPVTITPTPFPSQSPVVTQSATCPTTGSSPQTGGFSSTGTMDVSRRAPTGAVTPQYVPGAVAVTYTASARADGIDTVARNLRGGRTADLEFSSIGLRARVINVDPSRVDEAMSTLRSMPGVQSVSRIAYRQRTTVTSNDPYFTGFGAPAPYFETATSPGQWDMHIMHVDTAWNDVASSAPVTGAAIAIVDTGVDVTHKDLSGGKIIRTRCFVTYPSSSTSQTTGSFVTDTDGHGTNVAGIADADTNNAFGFASAGFSAPMLAYRIFPSDPTTGCEGSTSAQCQSNTLDEASAINDAVNNGAKVINLSLGGSGPCSSSDVEYKAVENAIAKNVVVVAAAGNGDSSGKGLAQLDCPAADPGVIAVGATTLNDAVSPATEAVASYSNYLTTTGSGHFMVAPGGDPSGSNDNDDLHWIENIYSSTAVGSKTCTPDFNSSGGANDCRVLIAGTSQATPHVVGVVSLILAVKPGYSPSQVAAALCNSATHIGDAKEGCGRVDAAAAVEYAKTH